MPIYTWLWLKKAQEFKHTLLLQACREGKKTFLAAKIDGINSAANWSGLYSSGPLLTRSPVFSLICVHLPHCFNLRERDGPSQQGSGAPYVQCGLRQPLHRGGSGCCCILGLFFAFFKLPFFFNQRCVKLCPVWMFRFGGLQDNRCTFSVYRHAGDASMKFDPPVQCKAFKVEQTQKNVLMAQNSVVKMQVCVIYTQALIWWNLGHYWWGWPDEQLLA